jgi:hypothetical protein
MVNVLVLFASAEVEMAMDRAQNGEPHFSNDQWIVTAEGLDHRDIDYFIPAAALAQRRDDGLWMWPLQLAEKTWCAAGPFAEAFLAALRAFGHRADAQLEHSLAAFGLPSGRFDEALALAYAADGVVRGSKAAAREIGHNRAYRTYTAPKPTARPASQRADMSRRPAMV